MLEDLARHFYLQGLWLAGEDRLTPAVPSLERAAALGGDDSKAWNVLGLCYYRLGQFGGARGAWERSLHYGGGDNRAGLYLEYLDSQECLRICRNYEQGLGLARQRDYREAARLLGSREMQGYVPTLNLLGLCLYASGKEGGAWQAWRQALALDRDNPDTLRYLQGAGPGPGLAQRVSRYLKRILVKPGRR